MGNFYVSGNGETVIKQDRTGWQFSSSNSKGVKKIIQVEIVFYFQPTYQMAKKGTNNKISFTDDL